VLRISRRVLHAAGIGLALIPEHSAQGKGTEGAMNSACNVAGNARPMRQV
jgi:hypothetical protein